nr:MAG TPA: Protein of unknown function (DUF722) [Bacteriophage sp.]
MTEELLRSLAEDPAPILNSGYRAKERIAARKERITQWRHIAESITANPENASGGGGYPASKVENCVAAISVLEHEIMSEIEELTAIERQTAQIIHDLVADPNCKMVLELRYLCYLRYEEIAVRMNYTFRWTQELHRRAVLSVQNAASALLPE